MDLANPLPVGAGRIEISGREFRTLANVSPIFRDSRSKRGEKGSIFWSFRNQASLVPKNRRHEGSFFTEDPRSIGPTGSEKTRKNRFLNSCKVDLSNRHARTTQKRLQGVDPLQGANFWTQLVTRSLELLRATKERDLDVWNVKSTGGSPRTRI